MRKVLRIIAAVSLRRKGSSDANGSRKNGRMAPVMMGLRHLLSSFTLLMLLSAPIWSSHAMAADPVAIRDILDAPRDYHLRQVLLRGTVRNVQSLDPYTLPAGTTCYGAYLFYLEDATALINVATFGRCGIPTVKDPDVEDGARIELLATVQAPSHGGYYLSFQGLKVAGEREGVVQAVADRITPLHE